MFGPSFGQPYSRRQQHRPRHELFDHEILGELGYDVLHRGPHDTTGADHTIVLDDQHTPNPQTNGTHRQVFVEGQQNDPSMPQSRHRENFDCTQRLLEEFCSFFVRRKG
eukprot:PhF_6_TR936/c0_g1_i1/m.1671